MRIFLKTFFFLLAMYSSKGNAQNNTMEAKAAYLLAEEEFSAGKYENCVRYLDSAAAKLGSTNAKILFLKILSFEFLSKKDPSRIPQLINTINAFEKSPDVSSFNEEKQLEVMKLKLKLARIKPLSELENKLYTFFEVTGWRIGANVAEMQELHGNKLINAGTYYYAAIGKTYIRFAGDELSEMSQNYYYANDADCSIGLNLIQQFVKYFGNTPEIKSSEEKGGKKEPYEKIKDIYIWKDNLIKIEFNLERYRSDEKKGVFRKCTSSGYMKVSAISK